ncbi:MAG: TetR/AcrR family transcriptional regulator [Nitrospirae bacterium]|nr:TetR/AcrR family transcriptional regulator [Nitrospirota bacterium]
MKKALEHSPTKERLIEAAERLMLAKGYEATSVEKICRQADLTKGSFFHYFGSKEDLARVVLDRFVSTRFQAFQQAPFLKKRDPLQRVYGYVDFAIELSRNPQAINGCLLGNFAQELSHTRPKIRSRCAHHFVQWADALRQDLERAKAKHRPKTAIDAHSLAEHFIAVMEGSLILAKANQDMKVVEKNLSHYKRYLKSLFEG